MSIKHIILATTPGGDVSKFRCGDWKHALGAYSRCIVKVWPNTGGMPMYSTVTIDEVKTERVKAYSRCIVKVWPNTGGMPMYSTVTIDEVKTERIKAYNRALDAK